MKMFSSGLSQSQEPERALEELAQKVNRDLGGRSCDLALVFVAEGYENLEPQDLLKSFKEKIAARCLIACNANGVIGDNQEVEMRPAFSVLAMHLPGVKMAPFTFTADDIQYLKGGEDLVRYMDLYPTDKPKFIVLGDPVSADVTKLLHLFNEAYPGAPVAGGLASGIVLEADNWLCLDGAVQKEGAVGVALTGDIEFEVVVSQGCRPIGEPFIITKAEQNVLYELAGKPPIEVLKEIFSKLPAKDQKLAQHSLFVGLVRDERRSHFERGDFLIRNIVGADESSGALAVGEMLETGQTLQFQLRDAEASEQDLKMLLEKLCARGTAVQPEGALLVSCCGRGKSLFGVPDHDVKLIQSKRGPLPMTGFFANGEFGPVEKKNYVHGYTSSLTLIR